MKLTSFKALASKKATTQQHSVDPHSLLVDVERPRQDFNFQRGVGGEEEADLFERRVTIFT